MLCNQVKLSGLIAKVYPVRQSPSGVNIARFVLEHFSTQIEAGVSCDIKCRLFCIWVSPRDLQLMQAGMDIEVSGFISQNARLQLVLHITEFLNKGK